MAERIFDEENERRTSVDKKVQFLIMMCSAGVPVVIGLWRVLNIGLLVFAPLCFLFISLLLLLLHQRPGQEHLVDLTDEMLAADGEPRALLWAHQFLACTAENQNRTDYLVDVYRAARRAFISSLITFAVVVAIAIISTPNSHDKESQSDGAATTSAPCIGHSP
jgi:hypothetical protein